MNEMILNGVVMILGTMMTAMLSIALAWVREKIKSEKINDALEKLEKASAAVVEELEQTIVQQMKQEQSWNRESIAKIRDIGQGKIKNMLGDPACHVIRAAGLELDEWIREYTEQAVYRIRKRDESGTKTESVV